MLFDIHTSKGTIHSTACFEPHVDSYEAVAADFWGEHCIECGAPACYSTCDKYERAPSSLCRRFANGIQPVSFGNGARGYAVQFKSWGKLELKFDGRLLSCRMARVLARFNWHVGRIVRHFGKKTINHYRSVLNKLFLKRLSFAGLPTEWRISCIAPEEANLMLSIFAKDKGEVMVRQLSLKAGENRFVFPLPRLDGVCYFRLASIEGMNAPVIFTELDVVLSKTASRAAASDRKSEAASAQAAPYVKCVVWDLDNTLWTGILVEDGPEKVKIKGEVVDVVRALDRRGIVSSICSKNDFDKAWAKLQDFGVAQYFVFPQINWRPKSENLKALARVMNIGLDALAFIDDSAHERGEVGEHLPMVRVYDEKNVERLLGEDCFNPPVSAESGNRRISYLAEMDRKRMESDFVGSHEDFLKNCEISLELMPVKDETVRRRCWELVNRTNQLTLAAHRYDENEFSELDGYAIRCRDKYGDYGIVGFISVTYERDMAFIREFVMSCRVAKKLCEQSVVLAVAKKCRSDGIVKLVAEIVPTGRNGALIEAFTVMPFVKKAQGDATIRMEIDCGADFDQVFTNAVLWNS